MICLSRKYLSDILKRTSAFLEVLYSIHQTVYIFIDKIDSEFSIDIHRIYGDSKLYRGLEMHHIGNIVNMYLLMLLMIYFQTQIIILKFITQSGKRH